MRVSVTAAKGQLAELMHRAEAGDEVILTRHGHPVVRLVPVRTMPDASARRIVLDQVLRSAAAKASAGPGAARSQDFLYDENGLSR